PDDRYVCFKERAAIVDAEPVRGGFPERLFAGTSEVLFPRCVGEHQPPGTVLDRHHCGVFVYEQTEEAVAITKLDEPDHLPRQCFERLLLFAPETARLPVDDAERSEVDSVARL